MATNKYETNPINIIISGFKQAFNKSQQLAVMLIIVPIVLGVVNFIIQIFSEVLGATVDSGSNKPTALVLVGIVLFILGFGLLLVAQNVFLGLQAFAMHKITKGEDDTFASTMSHAFSKFWQIFGVTFMTFIYALPYSVALTALVVLNIGIGFASTSALFFSLPVSLIPGVLLIVLMIRVYMRYAFATKYLFDGNNSVSASLELSSKLTKGRLGEVFGITSISSLVPFVPTLAVTSGLAILFEQLSEAKKAKIELPKQHILNYLVPALSFLLIGFVVLIALAIYYAAAQSL